MGKAERIFTNYGKFSDTVEYRYRGRTYTVEYPNDWSYCCTPAKVQHQNEQARIDREIAEEAIRKKKPFRYEDSAQYALDKFFEYCETGKWEE